MTTGSVVSFQYLCPVIQSALGFGPMTSGALFWSRSVEQNLPVLNSFEQRVAAFAPHIPVHAFERQGRTAVIEQ
jgi:hypothetical protein